MFQHLGGAEEEGVLHGVQCRGGCLRTGGDKERISARFVALRIRYHVREKVCRIPLEMVNSNEHKRREGMRPPKQEDYSIYIHRVHNFFLQLEWFSNFSLVDRPKRSH